MKWIAAFILIILIAVVWFLVSRPPAAIPGADASPTVATQETPAPATTPVAQPPSAPAVAATPAPAAVPAAATPAPAAATTTLKQDVGAVADYAVGVTQVRIKKNAEKKLQAIGNDHNAALEKELEK